MALILSKTGIQGIQKVMVFVFTRYAIPQIEKHGSLA